MKTLTIDDITRAAADLADHLEAHPGSDGTLKIWGVPRGGIVPAYALAHQLALRDVPAVVVSDPRQADVIVDDLVDSGATKERVCQQHPDAQFFPFFTKEDGEWLVFPWEGNEEGSAEDIVTRLLQYIGEDPKREGLQETPRRVLKAWKEWSTGYGQDAAEVLKTFEDGAAGYDEMVIVHNIPVVSKCEHHLADIQGVAHVGYIPQGRIVGLSKLARVVEVFARRLQVQERMTNQIADALVDHLAPLGVGVLVRANHACMSSRGVKIHGSTTTTSAMRGAFFSKPEARKEFLDLCKMAEGDR